MRNFTSAGGVVIGTDSTVLFCHPTNSNWKIWLMPKGQVEANEDIATAAKREVLEETGWRCEIVQQLTPSPSFKSTFYYPDHTKEKPHTEPAMKTLAFFLMRPIIKVQEPDWEHDKFVWVSFEKVSSYASQRELPIILEAIELYNKISQ